MIFYMRHFCINTKHFHSAYSKYPYKNDNLLTKKLILRSLALQQYCRYLIRDLKGEMHPWMCIHG